MRRYPGVSPFEEEQKDLFKGRESETRELLMKINLYRTLAIHAESGSGKSSIINTSILTQTRYGKDIYFPILINFEQFARGNESKDPKEIIVSYIIDEIKKNAQKLDSPDKLAFLKQKENDLWYWEKLFQANNCELLLIFDQFELLESYSKPQINYLGRELMDVINSDAPQEYYKNEQGLENEAAFEHLIEKKSKLKMVFVVREDKLGVLTLLKYYFPTIVANDYHLNKISSIGAKQAIVEPALAEGEFESPQFTYTDEALEKILRELKPKNAEKIFEEEEKEYLIDPLEMQIVCAGIENNVISLDNKSKAAGVDNPIEINIDNLPDFKDIVNQFYAECWLRVEQVFRKKKKWHEAKFITAKREIIMELIKDSIRVKVSAQSFDDFQKQILQELRSRKIGLVREQNDGGVNYYQITHDRLRQPFLDDVKEIKKNEITEKYKNLYSTVLQKIKSDSNIQQDLLEKFYGFLENDLTTAENDVSKIKLNKVPQELEELIKILDTVDFLSYSADQEGNAYVELAHPALIAQIAYEKERRLHEKKKKQLETKNKRLKNSIYLAITLLSIVSAIIGMRINYKRTMKNLQLAMQTKELDNKKKEISNKIRDSIRNVYFYPAKTLEFQNPTLSYYLAKQADKVDSNENSVKKFLKDFFIKRPYFVSKRLIDNDYEFVTADAYNCYLFSQDEISHYAFNQANSITNTSQAIQKINFEVVLAVRNVGDKIYYMQAMPKADYYSITLKNIDQKTIATFQYRETSLPYRAAFADDGKAFFLDGVIYSAPFKDSIITSPREGCKDIMSVAFTHDSKMVMVGYWGGQTLVYDVKRKDGMPIIGYFGGAGNSVISAIDISIDDKYLVDGDHDGKIHVWKTQDAYTQLKKSKTSDSLTIINNFAYNYYPYKLLSGHRDEVTSIAISTNNGKRIISGSKDKTAIVWDFEGNIKAVLRGHRDDVDHVQFTNDTSNVITKSTSGEVMIWSASKPDILFKKNQLELFDRYDYLAIGLNPVTFIPNEDGPSFTNKVQILEKELKTLPYVNEYPDNQAFTDTLKRYLKALKIRYEHIKYQNVVYKQLSDDIKRSLDLAYLDMIYNKEPQLTLNDSKRTKKDQTRDKLTYYKLVIEEYKSGFTAWNKVRRYLSLYLKSFTIDNFSYTMQAHDAAYIEGIYRSYYIKYPEVKKDYSLGIADVAYIYYNQKNYLAAKEEYAKSLKLLDNNGTMVQAINVNLNIIKCYLQLNQAGQAKDWLKSMLSHFTTVNKVVFAPKVISDFKKMHGDNFTDEDFSTYYILLKVKNLDLPETPASIIFKDYAKDMLNNNLVRKIIVSQSPK